VITAESVAKTCAVIDGLIKDSDSLNTNTMHPELRLHFLKRTTRLAHDEERHAIMAIAQVRHL